MTTNQRHCLRNGSLLLRDQSDDPQLVAIDTWLFLLDDILVDVPVDGHSRLRDNVARLRADMLNARATHSVYVTPPDAKDLPEQDAWGSVQKLAAFTREREQDDIPLIVLPPIIPLRDKRATIDFPCPTCKAKPGKECVKMSTRGKGNEPLGTPLVAGKRHAARRKAWNVNRGLA